MIEFNSELLTDPRTWAHIDFDNPMDTDRAHVDGSDKLRAQAAGRFRVFMQEGYTELTTSPVLHLLDRAHTAEIPTDTEMVKGNDIVVTHTGSIHLPDASLDALPNLQTGDIRSIWHTKAKEHDNAAWIRTDSGVFIHRVLSDESKDKVRRTASTNGDVLHLGFWLHRSQKTGNMALRFAVPVGHFIARRDR